MTKRTGFTLAEVLITLGIIGVVAAMTIPTLISNTNGAQFKTAYKKALSTLNQAAIMNIALDDYDFSSLVKPNDTDDETNTDDTEWGAKTKKTMAYILTNRLQSASNFEYTAEDNVILSEDTDSPINGTVTNGDVSANYYSFVFADGTSFSYNKNAAKCTTEATENCVGFIDVNGSTGPNQEIECTNNAGKVTGPTTGEGEDAEAVKCEVESSGVTDIYPVYFYGQTIVPATDAARAVLYNK